MDDTSIEIYEDESVVSEEKTVSLPMNFVSVGTVDRESVRVYIKQDVYKRIEKFAKAEMSKEVGGILIGEYLDEMNKKIVVISDYIEAKYTDASASTLTFTHETWNYVYKEKDKNYPDKKIVGWQHTHPGYGIFLSNYDVFIQENFFNLPWQIAYVVDPIADTRGFFEWKNGKTSKMSGFYVYDEVGREIHISEEAKPARKPVSATAVILASLLVVSVVVSVLFGIENNSIMRQLNDVKAEMNRKAVPTETVVTEQTDYGDVESFRVHTVREGDYMESICAEYNLDYSANIQKIKEINGITDADKIYAGQKLYLPIDK